MPPRSGPDPVLAHRVRARRLQRNWSIRHAADRAGISHTGWSRIESGRSAGTVPMLRKIAAALGCTVGELLGQAAETVTTVTAAGLPRPRPSQCEHGWPMRPAWLCRGCGRAWPCRTRRHALLQEHADTPNALHALMSAMADYATADLYDLPTAEVRARVSGWLR